MNNSKQNKWRIFFAVISLSALISISSSCEKYDELPPLKKQESTSKYKLPEQKGMSEDDKQKAQKIKEEYENQIK